MLEEMTSVLSYISFGVLKVASDNTVTINWYLLTYYIVGIMIIVNIFNLLWDSGRHIAASITTALLIMVFIFYSYRWFPSSITIPTICASTTSAAGSTPSCDPWPPIVNMCPDYMVLWKDSVGTNYCYDVHDTYSMKTYSGAGLTTGLTINGAPGQSAYKTSDLKKLLTTTSSLITSDPNGRYLRWEGVWDGLTLNAPKIPY